MTVKYYEQMQAHLDEGGQLTHKNAVDLLEQNTRLREALTGLYHIYCELDGREDVIHHLEECKLARQALEETKP